MEEINLFLAMNDLMPPGIENDDYDSEGDIHFLEELISNDPLSLLENESSNFDHHNDPSFPRPPPKPLDVEVFFDFEPDTGVLTTKVAKGFSRHYVLMPSILPTLPTLDPDLDFTPSHDSLLSGNKIFDLGMFIKVQSERLLSREKFSISFIRDPLYPVFDTLLPGFYANLKPFMNYANRLNVKSIKSRILDFHMLKTEAQVDDGQNHKHESLLNPGQSWT
nr:hypothetical protein [Tanacetum cinerariifolium]